MAAASRSSPGCGAAAYRVWARGGRAARTVLAGLVAEGAAAVASTLEARQWCGPAAHTVLAGPVAEGAAALASTFKARQRWSAQGRRSNGGLLKVDLGGCLTGPRGSAAGLRAPIGVVVSSPPSSDYALLWGCGPRSRRWTLGLFFLNLHLGSLFFFKISLNGKLAATILLCKLGS